MHGGHEAGSKVLSYFIAFGEGGGGFVPEIASVWNLMTFSFCSAKVDVGVRE